MASKNGERRMLFDTRGKRRHVIRVVYAILALLMGGSLFLVIGPVNIGELIGNSTSTSSAADALDERVERVERRVTKDPRNAQLLLTLTRAQIAAGSAKVEVVSETEAPTVTTEARDDFEAASESWNRYLKNAGDEPSAAAAQLVGQTFFQLAESALSVLEAKENVAKATKAQKIAAEENPTINSLSTLAIFQNFNSEFAEAEKTTKQAAAKAPTKAEAKNVEKQLAEYRKRADAFDKQKKQLAKVQSQVNKEQLKNSLGGLGGAVGE
ncbi:MAG TPA: hypothetical protein VFM94_08395 [Solirubrobacterales bacterium]|nr:hypothetical protein [Solirubrobacterales bacterium]